MYDWVVFHIYFIFTENSSMGLLDRFIGCVVT